MRTCFNAGWEFVKLPIKNVEVKPEEKAVLFKPQDFYGKAPEGFAPVEIPHDWLIENTEALYENSVGFYRKDFTLDQIQDKRFFLRFGAVYMNWALYINGTFAGEWKYGYSTVEFEITKYIRSGKNTAEVIAVYQSPNTRWYSGAGMYRSVYLVETGKTRIACDGVYFSAKENGGKWNVLLQTEVNGACEGASVKHTLLDSDGNVLEQTVISEETKTSPCLAVEMGQDFDASDILLDVKKVSVSNPKLWSCSEPNLYTLKTEVVVDGTVVDSTEQKVGFKTVVFDSNNGITLNGKPFKIYGACEHHDFGALGAAFNLVALKRKFLKLKKMGINAIRTSHNPQDEEFISLADEMGMLIDDDIFDMWEKPKTTYDYGNYFVEWHNRDCGAVVRRDRNHPSLLMWSIGNEIYDTHSGNGFEITKDLRATCRKFDPEKNGVVTIASNYMEWEGAQNCAEETDVVGYNYGERLYEDHHKKHPQWCIYGSETASTVQSRGIYHFPLSNRLLTFMDTQCSSLGNCSTNWGAKSPSVVVSRDRDAKYSSGQFIWTGWDYIGEPTPYSTKNSYFGQIDTAGFEKDAFYVYKAGWVSVKDDPFVHLLPYWDFNEGQLIDIRAFTNGAAVELYVNGISLGKKNVNLTSGDDLSATWLSVPYHKGEIEAVAYDESGKEIARDIQKSFGDADAVVAEVEDCSQDGIYYIDLSTVDADRNPVQNSRSRILMTVVGDDATLLGADNGDSTDWEQYKSPDGKCHSRKLFSNHLVAIVRSASGNFLFKAISPSLKETVIVFQNGKPMLDAGQSSVSEWDDEIPVRKIDLVVQGTKELNGSTRETVVKAVVYPPNATDKNLVWSPMMLEGVVSDCAEITVTKDADGETAVVKAVSDGQFKLTCTATNGSFCPQVVSELEFEVTGVGRATRNPFKLIEGCKASESLDPIELCFDGGAFTHNDRTWFSFDKVDFGNQGGDTVIVPIFSFDTELPFEIWEGNPDGDGTKLLDCVYKAPSIYNTYTPNSFVLPRRLFGIHTITFVFKTSVSFQGFSFEETPKALSKLNALDHTTIMGDAYRCDQNESAVTGIGNNVVLDFENMDFGETVPTEITICGQSYVDNTIHVKFSGENGDVNGIVEFGKNSGYEERTFQIKGLKGKNKVSFVFLPGTNFDFKWFKFR